MVNVRLRLALVTACALPAACEFDEVTVPEAEPILVVHAVLNTQATRQLAVVQNSYNGDAGNVGVIFVGLIPNVPARAAVSGARVVVTHLDPPSNCSSAAVQFEEGPTFDGGDFGKLPTGAYFTDELCSLRAGDRVALEVVAPDGRRVTGTTVIPGYRSISITTGGAALDTMPLQRERDSIRISVDPLNARAMQVDIVRADQIPIDADDPFDVPFGFVTDTMRTIVAGSATLPLEGDDGFPVFHPGRFYAVTVAVTDSNYFDFARSGSDIFTGRGFINHLDGGIGVFGSLVPYTSIVRVTTKRTDPREGVYRLHGSIGGELVDVRLELYMQFDRDRFGIPGAFATFVEGIWLARAITTSAEGAFDGDPFSPYGQSAFSLRVRVRDDSVSTLYNISGDSPTASGSATVDVRLDTDDSLGQLTLERVG